MKLTDLEKNLVDAMASWEIIDCHEHLGPEAERVQKTVDVFTLFSHYTHGDLNVARMSEQDYQSLFNHHIPLEERWAVFAPYWEQIRWGSYARAALLAAERFYGVDDINAATYVLLSEAMQKANTPGIYERVLKEACNIRTALTQCGRTDLGTPLLTPVMPLLPGSVETWQDMHQGLRGVTHADHRGGFRVAALRSLDDYLDAAFEYVLTQKERGAVGFKMMSNPYKTPNREEAVQAFEGLSSGSVASLPPVNPLRDYVVDQLIGFITKQDMVVCVHTGYWGDFRTLDPLHMIPILERHPNARFDIYHLGYPWMREALMLGKGFPNVWLNLCWTHVISQRFVMIALDEAIDLIPMNKLLAFGGDYGLPVEKVYGHLVMAREDIARVLGRRIEDGDMTESQALVLAKKWFWDNPTELYRLDV